MENEAEDWPQCALAFMLRSVALWILILLASLVPGTGYVELVIVSINSSNDTHARHDYRLRKGDQKSMPIDWFNISLTSP